MKTLRVWEPGGSVYLLGPETVNSTLWDSIVPSSVQTAPGASQSVVAGSTTVTVPLPDGCTVISHRMFLPGSSRLAFTTSPPVAVKAWSRRCWTNSPRNRSSARPNRPWRPAPSGSAYLPG